MHRTWEALRNSEFPKDILSTDGKGEAERRKFPRTSPHIRDQVAGERNRTQGNAGTAWPLQHYNDNGHLQPRNAGEKERINK